MACANQNIQVKDVYDCASDIFQEFEKIVTVTGINDASMLINKVKNVLELLEESVQKIEFLDQRYDDLKLKCAHLARDKLLKEAEAQNLKQDFEELEESWNKESLHLKSLINKLTAENKILHHKLAEKKDTPPEVEYAFKTLMKEQENLISKLKMNLKQNDNRFERYQTTIELLNAEIRRLNEVNKNLHLQYQKAQNTITTLKIEKKASEEVLNLQCEKFNSFEERFDELKKTIADTCEFSLQNMLDIYKPLLEEQSTNERKLCSLYQEQNELKQEVKDLKMELTLLKVQIDEYEKEISNRQNQKCLGAHSHLDQMFRIFLGVLPVSPQVCFLRNKRMYST